MSFTLHLTPFLDVVFFFNDTATTEIYTLSLHDALPILAPRWRSIGGATPTPRNSSGSIRSEEHTSELQSPDHLVCRLLLEKKKTIERSQPKTHSTGDALDMVTALTTLNTRRPMWSIPLE